MADTIKRLAGPTALAASAATVYTVPASTTAVIRSIHVTNESGTLRNFTLSVTADGAGKRFFYQVDVNPNDPGFDWTGSLVVAAGEVVQAYASAATALTLTMCGVEST